MYWIYDINQHFGVQFIYGWWCTYPSEKYESQLVLLFPVYGKNMFQHHQPVIYGSQY